MHKRALALGMLAAGAALLGTATAAQAAAADSGPRPSAAPAGGGAGKLGLGTLIAQPEQQLRTLGEEAQRYGRR
ncbi:hypothetical protein ABZ686_22565 [Streptomyces sp. NPDC006992]|uniref:hypothetical protein n=1 Tax=unclassified Streptomyces TaxID=2593676 RepID=UPI0033F358E3